MKLLSRDRWSPYIVGLGIGILSWIVFGAMHETIGVTRSFVHAVAFIEQNLFPEHADQLRYFHETLKNTTLMNWQMAFVGGIFIGSLLAAISSNSFNHVSIPKIWKDRFGTSLSKRFIGAFLGGMLLMIGGRIAGGCTSGHGISGGLQLAISSWTFIVTVFAVGIPFAFFFYKPRSHI